MKLWEFIRINGNVFRVVDQTLDTERGVIVADIRLAKLTESEEETVRQMERQVLRERLARRHTTRPATLAMERLREYPPRFREGVE